MSLPPLTICFIWHMHQPKYKDDLTGLYLMPWVRLHAVKDYLDMLLLLDEFPGIRQTFNLVPVLLEQLQDYARPGIWDHHQAVSVRSQLSDEDKLFILERCFDANPTHLISKIPAYEALYHRRNSIGPASENLDAFSEQEYFDIIAQFHLVWVDPLWIERKPVLKELLAKQSGYTLSDRLAILEQHRQIIEEIIPTYQRYQADNKIEISVTPYYHPILPLLIDHQSAKVGKPNTHLPQVPFAHPADARAHLEKAIRQYTELFGQKPRGLWPSEQSVSPELLALIGQYGFQWAVTSEGILAHSLGIHWEKDFAGNYRNIHRLAAPYRSEQTTLLFRHLTLSDLIGFTYASVPAEDAAQDCYQRLKTIQQQLAAHGADVPHPVVTIALDGENCWEYYPDDGAPFLRALYRLLENDATLSVSTVSDYLAQCPTHCVQPLAHVHAGSWIESDFHIWIGDPIKNQAWDLLSQTRADLLESIRRAVPSEDIQKKAWEELYIAEGSDWFWWYGEPHHSGQDELFDQQFRLHLRNVYTALGQEAPNILNVPLTPVRQRAFKQPKQAITPTIDGMLTPLSEWEGSGRYDLSSGEGAMHRGDRPVSRVYYGADHQWLYVRLEMQLDLISPRHQVVLNFCTPGKARYNSPIRLKVRPTLSTPTQRYLYGYELVLSQLQSHAGQLTVSMAEALADHLWMDAAATGVHVAMDDILEMAIPFERFGIQPGETLGFSVAVAEDGIVQEFVPQDCLFTVSRSESAHAVFQEATKSCLE